MLTMIDELIRHNRWANRKLMDAVSSIVLRRRTMSMSRLFHHVLVSN